MKTKLLRNSTSSKWDLIKLMIFIIFKRNDTETIQWRLAAKFVNESVLCFQEGIVNSPV
jgi:hypothetical protein